MIRFYCYNSPKSSSVGFTDRSWQTDGEGLAPIPQSEENMEIKELLWSGGYDMIMYRAKNGSYVFSQREISTGDDENGWHINFALEADEDNKAAVLALLSEAISDKELGDRISGLFSVEYTGGEHYELDSERFLSLIEELKNNVPTEEAQADDRQEGEAQASLYDHLSGAVETEKGSIVFLAASVDEDYFFGKNSAFKEMEGPIFIMTGEKIESPDESGQNSPDSDNTGGINGKKVAAAIGAAALISAAAGGYIYYRKKTAPKKRKR